MRELSKETLIEIIANLVEQLDYFAGGMDTINACLECGLPKKVVEELLGVTIT